MERPRGRHDDRVRIASEPGQGHDTVAFREADDGASHGVHVARDFVTGDERRLRSVWIEPQSREHVRKIDTRCADADPDLTVGGAGIRTLVRLEHVWRTEPGDHDLTHDR